MTLALDLISIEDPLLEFGGAGSFTDPRAGLSEAGPFDLRFGAARNDRINVGLVGPAMMVERAARWLERCRGRLPADRSMSQYPAFPGFGEVFRTSVNLDARWTVVAEGTPSELDRALEESDPRERFERVLDFYASGVRRLAGLEAAKPDVVVCCLSDEIKDRCWSVDGTLSKEERAAAQAMRKRREKAQLDLFDAHPVEEQAEDLLFRDFRRALKARAMRERMPVQIGTNALFVDSEKGQGPATRAWNSSVGLYYKAGGIPWRLKVDGPETCFVGISFHHLRTSTRHLVQSSIAQAFSSQGEGFALRGGNVEWNEAQGRNVHLTREQARELAADILKEYQDRTGNVPARVVLHKTSEFSADERDGINGALASVPIVEMVYLEPTQFRLVRFGTYPPNRGTLCLVNRSTAYLFTTGYMSELGTYPGAHIPTPARLRAEPSVDIERAAGDILGLTRMNWNTAAISGGSPVTLSFARRVGGIMAEYGSKEGDRPLSSFRYYM